MLSVTLTTMTRRSGIGSSPTPGVADVATASERRVWRLCHQEGIASEITTRKRGEGPQARARGA